MIAEMKPGKMSVRHRDRQIAWVIAMVVLAGFALGPTAVAVQAQSSAVPSTNPTLPETPASEEVLWAYQNAFRNAAQMALPVVVRIDIAEVVTQTQRSFANPFSFFFGREREAPEEQTREFTRTGLGSGVIVRRIGSKVYVLTNDHVVGDADEITLTLNDGRRFDAVLLGTDSRRDLAVVVFETAEEVPLATLGDSSNVAIGDWAFAIGNPLGFESTVTSGIISAVGRRPNGAGQQISPLTDYLQTDAAINQGNSGGALVNLAGEVIGINTWIASRSGGNIGLGFAIPINNAREAMEELISLGRVQDGWLGIRAGSALDGSMVASLELSNDAGVLVASTYRGSPASDAGLLPGDVIVRIDNRPISRFEDLVNIVGNISPGEFATFRIERDGRSITRQIQIGVRDEESIRTLEPWPGFIVMPLTDDLRTGLGLRNEPGQIVVGDIEPLSPAARAGLRRGDVIRAVNSTEILNVSEFYRALNRQADGEFAFRISRMGRELLIGLVR